MVYIFLTITTEKRQYEALDMLRNASRHRVENEQSDLIEGKGRVLVILLQGASDVSRTLTAESRAQVIGKSLLKVSIADFGVGVTKVE